MFETLVKEAEEEASLPATLIRERVLAVGAVTYFHVRDSGAGGEIVLLQPVVQYVYDLPLSAEEMGIIPQPNDDEVEEFQLLNVEEVCCFLVSARC